MIGQSSNMDWFYAYDEFLLYTIICNTIFIVKWMARERESKKQQQITNNSWEQFVNWSEMKSICALTYTHPLTHKYVKQTAANSLRFSVTFVSRIILNLEHFILKFSQYLHSNRIDTRWIKMKLFNVIGVSEQMLLW